MAAYQVYYQKKYILISMLTVKISLELVESLVSSSYCGTVILCELKDLMESHLHRMLMRGDKVSVRMAFDYAWGELILDEGSIDLSESE